MWNRPKNLVSPLSAAFDDDGVGSEDRRDISSFDDADEEGVEDPPKLTWQRVVVAQTVRTMKVFIALGLPAVLTRARAPKH